MFKAREMKSIRYIGGTPQENERLTSEGDKRWNVLILGFYLARKPLVASGLDHAPTHTYCRASPAGVNSHVRFNL